METTVINDMQKLLPAGSLLNGKYKILKQLSSRALGNLYLANDTKFRENVLIKELMSLGLNVTLHQEEGKKRPKRTGFMTEQ